MTDSQAQLLKEEEEKAVSARPSTNEGGKKGKKDVEVMSSAEKVDIHPN